MSQKFNEEINQWEETIVAPVTEVPQEVKDAELSRLDGEISELQKEKDEYLNGTTEEMLKFQAVLDAHNAKLAEYDAKIAEMQVSRTEAEKVATKELK